MRYYSFLVFYKFNKNILKLILVISQVFLFIGGANGQINKLNTELNQSTISTNLKYNLTNYLHFTSNSETTLLNIDSLLTFANSLSEEDYTVPSWTLLKMAVTSLTSQRNSNSTVALLNTLNSLKNKEMPYNIVCSINGAPTSRLGFAWFTNAGVNGGKVEIVQGSAIDSLAFETPDFTFNAKIDSVKNLNYNLPLNGLLGLAGIADSTKHSYTENKALATGLAPNTIYSYRVGKDNAWSKTGTFKTAKDNTDSFSFIYITDPQANAIAQFDVAQKTTNVANSMFPNVNFWLCCGDLVNSTGVNNSEWEYEQFFQTQQDIFLNKPWAVVTGNHDVSPNKNITHHFNTENTGFDLKNSTVPGSIYSFVYGDALFMAISFENYGKSGHLDSIANWMRRQVSAHPTTKWRIAFYHRSVYTGSTHQNNMDGKIIRDALAPVFDELHIDLALQGHDHIYEIIGPIKNKTLTKNAVIKQVSVSFDERYNLTGKSGGIFNVENGTMYFLNNSSGYKKYQPHSEYQMDTIETKIGLSNYFGMFNGRFGQDGIPTFSNITVSTDTIDVKTYEVNTLGISSLYDNFKIVKMTDVVDSIDPKETVKSMSFYPIPVKDYAYVNFKDPIDADVEVYSLKGTLVKLQHLNGSSQINLKNLSKGVYTLKIVSGSSNYKIKFIKD